MKTPKSTTLTVVMFRIALKESRWACYWACEGYRQLTGSPPPVGQPIESLPFFEGDLVAVANALDELRDRKDNTPVWSEWRYASTGGMQLFKCATHPTAFDESGQCCEAIGYFFSKESASCVTLDSPWHASPLRLAWLMLQAEDLRDYLSTYAVPSLKGGVLCLRFENDELAKVIECQSHRLVTHNLPLSQVKFCCPEC